MCLSKKLSIGKSFLLALVSITSCTQAADSQNTFYRPQLLAGISRVAGAGLVLSGFSFGHPGCRRVYGQRSACQQQARRAASRPGAFRGLGRFGLGLGLLGLASAMVANQNVSKTS